jgi:hypothetical protein
MSDDENPFTEQPICYSIDPTFCELAFDLKHALYSETLYKGDETKNEQQSLLLLEKYKGLLDAVHALLYGLFTKENSLDSPLPKDLEEVLPPRSKQALAILYPTICQAIKANEKKHEYDTNRVYGLFIHNTFHTYPYEMIDSKEEDVEDN